MKKINALPAVLPLFSIACSNEYTDKITETVHRSKSAKKSDAWSAGYANPFDIAGSIYNEILETLDQTTFNLQSIEEITVLIERWYTPCTIFSKIWNFQQSCN